jgi:iron complex outermembrane receptor protein
LNLPLTDTLAIKLAYLFESRDGFIENTSPSGDFGDRELQAWRLDLVLDVSEQWRLDYSYDHGSLEIYNYMFQAINPPAIKGDKGHAHAIKFSAQSHSKYGSWPFKEMATTAPLEASTSDIDGHSLILNFLNNVGEFKYIGAYRELQDEAYCSGIVNLAT